MQARAKVSYTGPDHRGLALGDEGRVLASDGNVVQVMWTSGARINAVEPVYEHDLVVTSLRSAAVDDSLDHGTLVTFSARRAYDEGGVGLVLAAMAESGHLESFPSVADEAMAMVTSRLRQDASFRALAAELDDDEVESVLARAASALLRECVASDLSDEEA